MKKFKRYGTIALASVMALSLVACGKKASDDKEASTSEEKSYPEATVIEDNEDWTTTEAPVIEDNRFTTIEGADAIGETFDDGTGKFTTYVNGGAFTMYGENGELVCDIQKTGSVEHGCQIYYDGFTMAKDCVYTMSFDISSTVERTVQWRVQINGGDYHLYAGDYITIGPEMQTINYDFTMSENSDPAPRFVINMGYMEEDGELPAHTIRVDNVSLFVKDGSKAQKIEGAPTPIKVKVNQIGYLPEDVKTVVVTSKDDNKFKIVKADTGETVYIGEYGELAFEKAAGDNVRCGDFTDFQSPGRYKIISSPSGESYEFTIGTDIYDDVYKDIVLMLYRQRCGIELDAAIAGEHTHPACHTEQATVYDEPSKKIDVSGGWHDAGDYGRYVVSGAKTVIDLLLAYEDFGYNSDSIGIPESGNGIPDLLDEAKFELDWMFKMQADDGGVYHKVTCAVFPETVLPQDETDELLVAPVSYAATADFVAVMAKAYAVFKDIDADYADKCLAAAIKSYGFMQANADMGGYKNPEEIVTGEYPDDILKDETLWAASELYAATKDATYLDTINTILGESFKYGLGWSEVGTFGVYALARAEGIDETVKQTAIELLLNKANQHIEAAKKEAFSTGMAVDYPWGSNMVVANNAQLLLMANNISPNEEYVTYAQKHRDYIFGVNGTAYCYVTGYGTLTPCHTHHRPSQVTGITMKGMLVGGPDVKGEDPYAAAVLYGYPGMLAYVDNEQSFSCNEVTVYWNSPLIYALTGLLY